MKCRNCTNLHLIRECKNMLWCDDVLDAPDPDAERECKYFKLAANADRLRTMTDEELAKWIVEIADCDECEEMHGFRMCDAAPEKACEDCWAGWLKAPVEVDE